MKGHQVPARSDVPTAEAADLPDVTLLEQGFPFDAVSRLVAADRRSRDAPDADLGGIRIAVRILAALPPGIDVQILDAGTAPHEPRAPFAAATLDQLTAIERATGDDRVRAFAAAVRARGYPVEQEASARAVLASALARPGRPVTDRPALSGP